MSEHLGWASGVGKNCDLGASDTQGDPTDVGTATADFAGMMVHIYGIETANLDYLFDLRVDGTVCGTFCIRSGRQGAIQENFFVPYGGSNGDVISVIGQKEDATDRYVTISVVLFTAAELQSAPTNAVITAGDLRSGASTGTVVQGSASVANDYGTAIDFWASLDNAVDAFVISCAVANQPTNVDYRIKLIADSTDIVEIPISTETSPETAFPSMIYVPVDRTVFAATTDVDVAVSCTVTTATSRELRIILNGYTIDEAGGAGGTIYVESNNVNITKGTGVVPY